MSDYVSLTDKEREEMLSALGVSSVSELFADVPRELGRLKVHLSQGRTQKETEELVSSFAARNKVYKSVFLGAGSYRHYIPAAVSAIVSREEFLTAYTPYQPEISQGILQAMFEYQTMMCSLTGMDVSNASHYSGATAAAEACLMCLGKTGRIAVYDNVNPDTLETVATYARARGAQVDVIPTSGGRAVPYEGEADAVYLVQLGWLPFGDYLADLLADGRYLKVGVGIGDDMRELGKIHPFTPAGHVDLGQMARQNRMCSQGLRSLTAHLFGWRISKGPQCSNWGLPELTQRQILYAATDAWVGRAIFLKMCELGLVRQLP